MDGKREWTCPICSTSFTKRGDYDRYNLLNFDLLEIDILNTSMKRYLYFT